MVWSRKGDLLIMKEIFMQNVIGIVLGTIFITNNAYAMTFSQPRVIGDVGFPTQAPYHGFVASGESYNSGVPYTEDISYSRTNKPTKTYVRGIARFGDGINALYCDYNFKSNDYSRSIKFGGENDYVVTLDGSFKNVLKVDNDANLALYTIYHAYCVTELNIIGKQPNGKWVSYINSKEISRRYFNGKDSYKEDGGVIYDKPISQGDTLIVKYRRWHWQGASEPEGEFRFKWDDKAQWFGIEQVVS